jgi:hypothetical protein
VLRLARNRGALPRVTYSTRGPPECGEHPCEQPRCAWAASASAPNSIAAKATIIALPVFTPRYDFFRPTIVRTSNLQMATSPNLDASLFQIAQSFKVRERQAGASIK